MVRKVLITGGSGFIGSNLVEYLNAHSPDWEIVVLDDLSTGVASNLDKSKCTLVVGSVLDSNLLNEITDGVKHIVHLAAIGSVPRSIAFPVPTHEANITGTLRVLEAARQNSVEHVIVASSSSVYGSNPNLPRREFDWTGPLSPYAVSKLATEAYANAYTASYGMKTAAFRFFNVFGPRQRSDHQYAAVIPKFVASALENNTLTIHGDGTQTRDFTFVESICNAIHTTISEKLNFDHPVNLAFGTRVSILEVVEKLEELLQRKLKVEHIDSRLGDVWASQADTSLLNELIPSITNLDFEVGLRKTIEWFQSDSSALC